ncbi:hypothetical protein BCR41DRAFT_350274 [Lobosporangium transversale]|uniref:RNI-like protein n=1 Tax=Lobosporangium transversale TaxID=64571 RepID=A0A1Y2GT05_9FUNG|nr:hypothetical protein BCR41DRAFT_350274 [Lobosporangium transversale]ORZ21943.1 hypothetical protein BCR41DRAFT_350274 [Lobosporangium transversale]|eukprot:XP_021883194.1 hypothetical protein BCR41DRAFT_350274 [Lobosporangium transversale]
MINMLETKETMTNLLETKEEMINLLLETEEKNNEMIKLQDKMLKMQLEAREEKDDKIQHQALDKFTILQKHAHAILTQGLEPHECPIPRLFIILPVDHTKWDSMNVLKNKFRLHFLCECGNHTAMASKSTESQIHITKHKGYEIRDCKGFFHKYGKYMFILLQWLKLGMLSSAPLNCSIDYMETFSKKYPALNNITTIDDYEGLEEADLQQLGAFLRVDDEGDQFGNLYRITTESGHVKWVCFQHYRSAYKEKEQKAFENAVKVNGAKYDPHLGKVIATLKSRDKVIGFFDALTNARRVYELDITFDCDWAEPDLVVLEKALAALNVSTLRLGLERASGKADSTPLRYQTLVRIIELSNIKAIHIALSPDLIKLPSLRPGRSSHLHKLSFEMKVHQLEADELLVVVNYLKTNTALTALNLDLSRIKKKEVLALAEALKANTTLTTLGLESNLIGDEETLALAEALKANITLSTLTLAGDSIGNKGALALAEVLKANTTLTTLTLAGDSIGNKGALALLEALKGNTSLISLCLECDSIGEEGALALSEALEANTTLTYLGLWSNLFGKEEALLLSEVLKANTTLTGLNLHGNSLRDEGALALSEALKVNVTLVSLELERTLIGNEGARALAEALKVNATLVSLGLEENLIGNEGARALAEALKSNMTLTTVKLGRNFVGAKETLALSKLLKTNIILTTLDLESCW